MTFRELCDLDQPTWGKLVCTNAVARRLYDSGCSVEEGLYVALRQIDVQQEQTADLLKCQSRVAILSKADFPLPDQNDRSDQGAMPGWATVVVEIAPYA